MKNIAAFFDIDGTLYREALLAEVFKKLIKYEMIEPKHWYDEVKPKYDKWDRRKGDYDEYLLKMADIYVSVIKGMKNYQIEFIAKQVISQKGDRVYTYTRDRIEWHKKQGHKVLTISGSPIELVKEMSQKYGFDDYRGAEYVLNKDGIYTGEVKPMWDSDSKNEAIREFVDKYNIDLDKSYAYGDTTGDLSMFNMVKYPIAVNPTRELLKNISMYDEIKKKVNIIVERKDMVYNINMNCIKV